MRERARGLRFGNGAAAAAARIAELAAEREAEQRAPAARAEALPMPRRIYLAIISRLSRRQAKRFERFVLLMRPRARRRAALEAAQTPEVRLMAIAWGVGHDELERIRDLMARDRRQ